MTGAAFRVAHLLAPAAAGGLETVVTSLGRGQTARGHDVWVVPVLDRGFETEHPFVQHLIQAGLRVHVVVTAPRGYAAERAAVRELLETERVQVLHTHGYRVDVIDGSVARRARVAHVATVHSFVGGSFKSRLYEWVQRRALRQADAVVAVSRPIKERLATAGVPANRLTLIPNAWPERGPGLPRAAARHELGCEGDRFLIGWVGRLTPEKGADVLLDAIALVRHLRIQVAILGDGRDRTALQRQVRRLGIESCVTWCGTIPQAWRIFSAFDLYVQSSRIEGTPMVLLEAVAAGVPTVATAVGGVPDIVGPEEVYLVPPDDPRALAEAIERVYTHPDDAARRAIAARRVLESYFDPDQWLAAYDRVYAAALQRCRVGASA